ncbi:MULTISPECIES: DUF6578 domain-containing protein [Pseudofrankia]|uniref:DUF6578 domain-containing protein n=1 Tax=Pseudofrankia TaxID=2994363 RepID=UPI000234D959|nr:DUF6578 domain-containing protein [Pseudofrankia saprophytica]
MRLPVHVESWQIECCMDPFSVGDRVRWQLVFTEQSGRNGSDGAGLVELDLVAAHLDSPTAPMPPNSPRYGTWLGAPDVADGLSLYWVARQPTAGPVRLTGYIGEDHHAGVPESFPETHGTIRGIRVQTRRMIEVGPKSWQPTDEPPSYEDVTTAPKRFQTALRPGQIGTVQTGILVDLDVGTDPAS